MNVRKKYIVGVTLLIMQLSSVKTSGLDQSSEDLQIDLDNPTASLPSTSKHQVEKISDSSENSAIRSKAFSRPSYSVDKNRADKIITDIQSQHFDKALKKMQRLRDDLQGNINYIIHKVYDGTEGNLYLILQLVENNNDLKSNLAIYQALNYEMNINYHNSYLGRLKLLKSFSDKTGDQSSIPADDLDKAEELKTEFENNASGSIAEALKEPLKASNSAAISKISENVYNDAPTVYHTAMIQALYEVFDEVKKPYFVELFSNRSPASQSVYAYSAMWIAMVKRERPYQTLTVYLASELKRALERGVTERHAIDVANSMKLALPKSVYNIVFETNQLCIVHANYRTRAKKNEYLFASENVHNNGGERRQVYTWVKGGHVPNGYWYIERHDDIFYIKNSYYVRREHKYRTEYLYAAYFTDENADERRVFTWIAGEPDDDQFNWVFVPGKNDTIVIKNAKFKEFLYASDKKEGDDRRKIYTRSSLNWQSRWRIVKC